MKATKLSELWEYYPDLMAEYRGQVLREARAQRADSVRRLRKLFGLDDEKPLHEERDQRADAVRRLLSLLEDEEGRGE